MSRLTKIGPLAKSAIATVIGLAFGYLTFALVLLCAAFFSLIHGRPIEDEISFLFFCWIFLLIPLGVGWIFLAWLIVLPVEKALRSYSASRTAYLTTGGILAAMVAYAILHLFLIEAGLLWEMGGGGLWYTVPMVASITSGLLIGDQLWKRRPPEEENFAQ